MNRILIVLLILSILGNLAGAYLFYKFRNLKGYLNEAEMQLNSRRATINNLSGEIDELTARLDKYAENRMVFLHHSVGKGLLNDGGLRNSLLDMGILVKSATYGDSLGEDTDMNYWLAKFRNRINEIYEFNNHPNHYYDNGTTNDIVMFKSCFPNSDIVAEGSGEGDASSPERTIANYQATFAGLEDEMRKYPDKLFIYLTAPPRHPDATTLEYAARAREFNDWLIKDFQPNYVKETGLNNFFVFDLFGTLADQQNVLKKEYRRPQPKDSHPNQKGSTQAVAEFIKFFRPIWIQWQNQHDNT